MQPLFTLLPDVHDLFLPRRQTEGSAGHDLRAFLPGNGSARLETGATLAVRTGVRCHLRREHAGLILGRSGLRKLGVWSEGRLIDSEYTGEIVVLLRNMGEPLMLRHGDRIAQFTVLVLGDAAYTLPPPIGTRAGGNAGGFGSTGRA